jgi:hypothetical protein
MDGLTKIHPRPTGESSPFRRMPAKAGGAGGFPWSLVLLADLPVLLPSKERYDKL